MQWMLIIWNLKTTPIIKQADWFILNIEETSS